MPATGTVNTSEAASANAVQTNLTPVERLEALVVKELEAEEAARCARTLSVLTQTLQTLQRMRTGGEGAGNSVDYDDMPEDMDAFRNELARRIRLFVESRRAKQCANAAPTQAGEQPEN